MTNNTTMKNYKQMNLEMINKWISDLDQQFITTFPLDINLLEKTKIIKKNILLTLDTAHKLSKFSNEQEIFDTTASMENIEKEIEKIKKDVVSVAVFGQMSSGKSSFLNSLVGEKLLTVAEERATATITIIRHIDNFDGQNDGDIEIHYKTKNEILYDFKNALDVLNKYFDNQVSEEHFSINNLDDILLKKEDFLKKIESMSHKDIDRKNRKYVKSNIDAIKLILNGLEDNRDNIDKIIQFNSKEHNDILTNSDLSIFINNVVFYKDIELLRNIELIDTPGLGSNSQLDTRKSEEFILQADIVMIITDAKEPMQKESEVDVLYILEDIQKKEKNEHFFDKVFIIVNKIDDTVKEKKSIKELLKESLNDAEITVNDKNILFISSLFEYHKRFNKLDLEELHFKNKKNIGKEDLLNIEKTIYDFSAAEATAKFLTENIKKIDFIFDEANRNFEHNIETLEGNIKETEGKIQKFDLIKDEIKTSLSEKLNDIVNDKYRSMKALMISYINDEIVRISNEDFFKSRAKKENTFSNANDDNTSSENYKNLAKKLMEKMICESNDTLQDKMANKVLKEDELAQLKDELFINIQEIQEKYEEDYNVVINLDLIHIEPIKINLSQNIDLDIGIWKSIKQFFNLFLWGKEDKYIDISSESWEKYTKNTYETSLKEEITLQFAESEKTILDEVNKTVNSIISTIENQLKQQLNDQKNYGKDKKETMKKKNSVQASYGTLKDTYISQAKQQNINLFK